MAVLDRWNAAVAAGSANWLAVGTSITEGQGASVRSNRWIDKTLGYLRAASQPGGVAGGVGYIPAWYGTFGPDSTWQPYSSRSGFLADETWIGNLSYKHTTLNIGTPHGSVTFTVIGTAADIWYINGAGSFTWQVDGGSATTITLGGTWAHTTARISLGASGSHTITLTDTSTGTDYTPIYGLTVFDGDTTQGIRLFDAGHAGYKTSDFIVSDAEFRAAVTMAAPDLVTIELYTNDLGALVPPATVKTNIQTLISRIRTAMVVDPSIFIVSMYKPQGNSQWAAMDTAVRSIVTDDPTVGLLDFYTSMGETSPGGYWSSDALHPSDNGHAFMAEIAATTFGVSITNDPPPDHPAAFTAVPSLALPGKFQLGTAKTPSTGTNFTVNQTDSTGLTDTAAFNQTKVFTDSAGLADATLLARSLVFTDSVGLTDAAPVTRSLVFTDSVGLADTSTVEAAKLITAIDSAGLTDVALLVRNLVYTDSAGLTDATILDRALTVTDSAGLTDAATVQTARAVTTTDSVGLTDAAVLDRTLFYTDSAGLTDAALLARTLVYTDSAGLTDSATVQAAKFVTQTDSVGLTDAAALSQPKTFTDSVGLVDIGFNLDIAEVFTDSIGLTDAALLIRSLAVTDSAGLTDAATRGLSKAVTPTDDAGLTDTTLLQRSSVLTDSAGLTDSAELSQQKPFTDSAGLTDTSLVQAGRLVDVTDSTGLTDNQVFNQAKGFTDSTGLTDVAALIVSKTLTDSTGLTDTALVLGQRDVVATDIVGLTDTRLISRGLGFDDSAGLSDAATIIRQWLFTDSVGLTDDTVITYGVPIIGKFTGRFGHLRLAAYSTGNTYSDTYTDDYQLGSLGVPGFSKTRLAGKLGAQQFEGSFDR